MATIETPDPGGTWQPLDHDDLADGVTAGTVDLARLPDELAVAVAERLVERWRAAVPFS